MMEIEEFDFISWKKSLNNGMILIMINTRKNSLPKNFGDYNGN